jgi:hypothetical protein
MASGRAGRQIGRGYSFVAIARKRKGSGMGGVSGFMDSFPLTQLMIVMFVLLAGARELGGWTHRRFASEAAAGRDEATDKGMLVSAVLGLLALLIAFTFSLSLNRYDQRRAMIVEEANAIGTAEMRVRLLPEPHDALLSSLLQDYARTRLAYGQADARGKPALEARSLAQRNEIQGAALGALAPEARSPMAVLVAPSINAVLDIGAAREALNSARIPGTILVILIAYNLLTAVVLGFALTGKRAHQRPATIALFASLTLTVAMIMDLDRPQRGSIRLDQTPMQRLVEGFAPVPEATAEVQPILR